MQQALVSWWPLPNQWTNVTANGYNWRHWTEWDEEWYLDRLEFIRKGDSKYGIPLSASSWRNKLRGMTAARLVTTGIDTLSKNHVRLRS